MKNRESASCWDVVKRHKWLSIAGLLAVAAVAAAVAVKAAGGKGGPPHAQRHREVGGAAR